MTSERKRAVLAMVLTFVIGIVIGAFIPGAIMRARFSNDNPDMNGPPVPPSERFERMLYRVVNPDSAQIEKIKPLAEQTSVKIEAIHNNANNEIKSVIDSLKTNLEPILTPDQLKQFNDFGDRLRRPPGGGPRGRGPGGPRGRGPEGPDGPGGRGPGGPPPR